MSFEQLLNHKCDIYHLRKEGKSPGYGLPEADAFDYPEEPDVCSLKCHFNVKGDSISLIQREPNNDLTERIKLNLPIGTDIRILDKVTDCGTGLSYTVIAPPKNIRNHHVIAHVERRKEQKPL